MEKMKKQWAKKHITDLSGVIIGALLSLISSIASLWGGTMDELQKYSIIILEFIGFAIIFVFTFRSIKSIKWTKCEDFANSNPERICKAVRDCIVASNTIKSIDNPHFTQSYSANELFSKYLDLIRDFLVHYAQGNLNMTLPQSPYIQISDTVKINGKTKYEQLVDTLALVKGSNNEKDIILTDTEKDNFITSIYNDFKERKNTSDFEEYILKHNQHNVKIEWKIDNNPPCEYILIGKSVYLEIDNVNRIIKIQFDKTTIDNNAKIFIINYQSTREFLETYVKTKFENMANNDVTINVTIRKQIIDNFNKMLKTI